MSALAMILMAAIVIPEDGPEKVSGELAVPQRLDLSGVWDGNISHFEGKSISAGLKNGHLIEWHLVGNKMTTSSRDFVITGGGIGQFRLKLNGEEHVGIYQRNGDETILCFRPKASGYPTSFRAGDGQCLLILRRVKSRK